MTNDNIIVTRLLGDTGAAQLNDDGTMTLIMFLHGDPAQPVKYLLTRKEAHVLSLVVEHLRGRDS